MTGKKCAIFIAVLLSTCAFNYCLEADKSEAPASLHDTGKDLSEDSLKAESDLESHGIAKRIVVPPTWHRVPVNTPSPYLEAPVSEESPNGQNLNEGWSENSQYGHSYEFHHQNPAGSPKLEPSYGHNEFSQGHGHHHHDKEDDWYEGISRESTKPRREKLPTRSEEPSDVVAKYEPSSGVRCPSVEATGLFVYPPDCRFYVTCHNGRAFVQPCAPGTLFSPDSLECDFPHKVKCYNREDSGSPSSGGPAMSARLENPDEPVCPADLNGLMPHPSECTKFLQCANGNTYVMDCGPGTVFNPSMSVCDYPRNVKGCEDVYLNENIDQESEGEYTSTDNPGYSESTNVHKVVKPAQGTQRSAKKIECPPDQTGLLPHPETCEKFLQCAGGRTFIMDCGPGTVYNPLTTVCDWPYNVPGCGGKNKEPAGTPNHGTVDLGDGEAGISVDENWNTHGHGEQNHNGNQGASWNQQHHGGQGSSWNQQGHGTQGNSWNQQGHGSQGSSWNQQGHGSQGSSWGQPGHGSQGSSWGQQGHGSSWGGQGDGNLGSSWNQQGHGTQGGSWNQQGHGTQGSSSGQQGHGTQGGSWNQQGHNTQGSSLGQQGHGTQGGSWNQQGHGTQGNSPGQQGHGNYGGSWNQQGHGSQGGSWGQQGQGNYGGSWNQQGHGTQGGSWGQQDHGTGSSWNQPGYNNQDPTEKTTNQQGHRYHNQWTGEGSDQYGAPTGSVPSTNNNGYPHSTNGYNHPHHQGSTPSSQYPTGTFPNHNQPGQPHHAINGHGYPTNIHPSESQSSESNEDEGIQQNQGHAWAQPGSAGKPWSQNPINNDRRNYSRTHGKDDGQQWSVPEMPHSAPGVFQPNNWNVADGYGQNPGYTNRPATEGPKIVTNSDKPYERPANQNIHNSNIDRWSSNYHPAIDVRMGESGPTPTHNRPSNAYPTGIHVVVNGTRGHFITKEPEVNQGHSNTRQQNAQRPSQQGKVPPQEDLSSSGSERVVPLPLEFLPPTRQPVTWKPRLVFPEESLNITMTTGMQVKDPKPESPEVLESGEKNREFLYNPDDPNTPTVSIELEEDWNSSVPMRKSNVPHPQTSGKKFTPNAESTESVEEESFGVEVQTEETKPWKPQLVFPNRDQKKPNDDKAVVMRIGGKNSQKQPDILAEVEVAPFLDEEPPFPAHYEPPKKSSSLVVDTYKPNHLTPLSGQVVRLRGGSNPSEGYVEVQGARPGWGVVCDARDGWTLKEAHVVCKQLGYGRGAALAWQGRPKTSLVPNWIAANSVDCQGNETKFQSCKFTHKTQCDVENDAIAVRCLPHRVAHCRKDELPHNGQCYHFAEATLALNHAEAHDYCQQRGSRLVDLMDQPENDFVSELLLQNQPHVNSIMTSGMGFTTLNRTIWMWEDSVNSKFKYNKWWPGWLGEKKVAPFAGSRPVCIIMTRKFPCHDRPESKCTADYFFWDIEDCASSNKGHSYVCERPYDDIGCVYGNGNQYYGNASVAATGRECLSWSDPQIARSLITKVPIREARDKLRPHNFCRNPNPNKENKPWCFTGPRGEYEYCDIPYCGKILSKKTHLTGSCKPKHFECLPGECIPSPWVCDGEEDCTNGADERKCTSYMNFFKKTPKHRLDGYEVEKWLFTSAKTCALRCKEADFTCRSFTHHPTNNTCYLSDSNVGMTGALVDSSEYDYYEMRDHTIDCEDMFTCKNQKCINKTKVCDGKNDCFDRSDEQICTVANLDYAIRLAGANSSHEGRIEVKILGKWGQVCDDSFDQVDADVVCRELGFKLGSLEVRPGGFYGNLDPPEDFMVDQLKCRGNESTIRDCDFEGWGRHNCQPEEAVGVICKTDVDTCQEGQWKCDNSPMCIPTPFICDEVADCADGSDESPAHCNAPFELRLANGSSLMEGRVEIRHHGIWGTVCDDDFSNATAKVICRSLGYGGPAMVKKDGYFGPGTGPIWLDEVFCYGNETQLYRCEHDHWGRHNCDHNEDAGVVCSPGRIPAEHESRVAEEPELLPEVDVNELLPTECGKRPEDFDEDDDLMFERVVRSSIAPRGSYPWQASIRVRGHVKSNHWCGAVVLSPLHVLTAAHCLEGYNKGTYFVRAGDYNTDMTHLAYATVVFAAFAVSSSFAWYPTTECSCPVRGGSGLFPFPPDCTKFFNCANGRAYLQDCGPGTAFNPKLLVCDWPQNVDCGYNPYKITCPAYATGQFAYLPDCRKFINCWQGSAFLQDCGPGTAFNPETRVCDWPQNVQCGYDPCEEVDEGTEAEANIEDYYIHKDFGKGHRLNNDIALVLLKGRGIPLGRNVMPICLPHESIEYPPGLNCTISGFGSVEAGSSRHSRKLRFGWVPLLDQTVCKADHVYGQGSITDGMICAGHLDGGPDTCDGDSGGPLACLHNGAFTLYGLTSWGQHCGEANKPGVYVRIAHYRQWIDEKIKESLIGR